MTLCPPEPSLNEMLSDPLIEIVMRADGVDPQQLRPALQRIARGLRRSRGATPEPCGAC